jgi:hypothetical protein
MIPVHGNSNWSAVTISVAGPEDLAQGRKRLREKAIVGSKGSKNMPQGLKPDADYVSFAARQKSCPFKTGLKAAVSGQVLSLR